MAWTTKRRVALLVRKPSTQCNRACTRRAAPCSTALHQAGAGLQPCRHADYAWTRWQLPHALGDMHACRQCVLPDSRREHGQPFHVMRRASRRRSRSLRCQSPRTPATCARASCSAVRTAAERLLASGLPPLAEVAAPQPPAHQCGAACIGHRHAWAVSSPGCRRPPPVAACTFQSALANIATLDRHAVSCSRSTSTSKFTCRLTHRH